MQKTFCDGCDLEIPAGTGLLVDVGEGTHIKKQDLCAACRKFYGEYQAEIQALVRTERPLFQKKVAEAEKRFREKMRQGVKEPHGQAPTNVFRIEAS